MNGVRYIDLVSLTTFPGVWIQQDTGADGRRGVPSLECQSVNHASSGASVHAPPPYNPAHVSDGANGGHATGVPVLLSADIPTLLYIPPASDNAHAVGGRRGKKGGRGEGVGAKGGRSDGDGAEGGRGDGDSVRAIGTGGRAEGPLPENSGRGADGSEDMDGVGTLLAAG